MGGRDHKAPSRESYFAAEPGASGAIGQVFPSSSMVPNVIRDVEEVGAGALDESVVETYCARIVEAARLISKFAPPSDPAERAAAFHYLLQSMAYAFDQTLVSADPLEPMWSQPYRQHLVDIGAACPDGVYRRVMLRDDKAYRVYGRFGNAPYVSMDFRQSKPLVTLMPDDSDLDVDSEGNFEVFVGGPPRERNWRPLHKGLTGLVVREFFHDWTKAQRSHLRIECLDGGVMAPRAEQRTSRVVAEWDVLGDWILEGAVRYWIDQTEALIKRGMNEFLPDLNRRETKLPVTTFGMWDIKPDEALVIEVADPQASYWGFQLTPSLWGNLDFANRLTSSNPAFAHRDADGVYRFVLSAKEPGLYNWLDTTGLARGIVIVRFCCAANPVAPRAKVVKLSDLGAALPGARTCMPEQRRAQIAERREGVARMLYD